MWLLEGEPEEVDVQIPMELPIFRVSSSQHSFCVRRGGKRKSSADSSTRSCRGFPRCPVLFVGCWWLNGVISHKCHDQQKGWNGFDIQTISGQKMVGQLHGGFSATDGLIPLKLLTLKLSQDALEMEPSAFAGTQVSPVWVADRAGSDSQKMSKVEKIHFKVEIL